MNSHQRRKGQRAQKQFLERVGFTPESYSEYWVRDGYQAAKMLDSASDRRLVSELALRYPRAELIRQGAKNHPEDKASE